MSSPSPIIKPLAPPVYSGNPAAANFSALHNYFSNALPSGMSGAAKPGASDIAKFILLNAAPTAPVNKGPTGSGSSLMSKIFDLLSRPNYAMANVAKDMATGPDPDLIKSFISGLAGTQKTTFKDVAKEIGVPDGPAQALTGFLGDVFLDPSTYIPAGGIAKSVLGKLGKGAAATDKLAKDLPLGQKILNSGEPIHPEAFGLPPRPAQSLPEALKAPVNIPKLSDPALLEPKSGLTTPQLALPGMEDLPNRIKIPQQMLDNLAPETSVGKAKEVVGQIPFKFKNFKLSEVRKEAEAAKLDNASKIVEGVTQGNIREALKLVPPTHPPITPANARTAETVLQKWKPGQATAQINKQFPNTLNAKEQVRLWYNVRNHVAKNMQGSYMKDGVRTPKTKEAKEQEVIKKTIPAYRAIENKLIAQGKVPRTGTGENVRLSDVIQDLKTTGVPIGTRGSLDKHLKEFADNISTNSPVGQAVERLRARGAIEDSVPVKLINDSIGDTKSNIDQTGLLSNAQTQGFDKFLKHFSKNAAKASGVSPAGVDAAKKLINHTLDAGKSRAQIAVQQNAKVLDDIVAKGLATTKINSVVTRALEKDLGTIPKWAVNGNKGQEFLMGRVATWWGQSDLRPISLDAIASSAATAEARGTALGKLFKPFDDIQRAEAFRLAQGMGQASVPEVGDLAGQIGKMMDDLVGQASGSSVLLKSGVDMDLLNKWMRRYGTNFQFTKGKLKNPITGALGDFSKGTDWLSSWRFHDIKDKDPADFMFRTMQALEQSTREKALFDEIGERFGSTVPGKGYRTQISGHKYLEGYYFPDDISKQIPRMVKDWSPGTSNNNEMLKLYDRVLSMWKTGVTIYRPAHHIRNLVGDVYMGMLDGVNSVKPYRLAVQVQRSMKGAYDTMMDVDRLVEIGAVSRTLKTPLPGTILFRNKSGIPFTAEQIAAVAHQKGLLEHVKSLEDIIDLGQGKGFSLMRPLGGKVQQAARSASELQAHNARIAHFIDKVIKSRGNDLPTIFEDASRRARKFHPSGLDLTQFEKTVLRRVIPFYSWMRKSTPLLLQGIVMKPGVSVLPAKIGQAMQTAAGIEGTDRSNPFPVDQMFPQWLRDEGIGPVSLPDGWLGSVSNQSPAGYVQAGVGLNPLSQLVAQLQDPGKTIGSGLTPIVKVPFELGVTGQNIFSGAPITGPTAKPGALQDYIGQQLPIYGGLQGILGVNPTGQQTAQSAKSGGQSSTEALVNFLTGMGIKGTGPYIRSAHTEVTLPIKAQRNAAKQNFMAQLRSQMGM